MKYCVFVTKKLFTKSPTHFSYLFFFSFLLQIEVRVIGKPYDPVFTVDRDRPPESSWEVETSRQSTYIYNITDLIPSTQYEINVYAYNGAGPGLSSRIEKFTISASVDGNVSI